MKIAVLALAAVTTGALGMMQTPPVKMGLWESTEITTSTVPAGMVDQMKKAGMESGVPMTSKKKMCITPEVWEKAIGLKPPSDKCTVSNRSMTASQGAMTVSCDLGGVALVTDIAITFDSASAWHGKGHSVSTYPASMMGGGKMISESTVKANYLGAACGDVAPGHPVFER